MRKLWRKFLALLKSLKSSDDEPTNPQPDPVDPQLTAVTFRAGAGGLHSAEN